MQTLDSISTLSYSSPEQTPIIVPMSPLKTRSNSLVSLYLDDFSPATFSDHSSCDEDVKNKLTEGMKMLKIPNKSSSRPEQRLIKVNLIPLQISWESRKKKQILSSLNFDCIREIRLGQNTKAFELHGRSPEYEERAFSVIYTTAGQYKVLNLVAPSNSLCKLWVYGLHMLLTQALEPQDLSIHCLDLTMASFLKRMWNTCDIKHSNQLNLDSVTDLMRKLNMNLSKSQVKSTFKNAEIDKMELISFDAFEKLYKILRFRPEISQLFNDLAQIAPSTLNLEEFRHFIVNIQKSNWNQERIDEIYQKYSNSEGQMDMDHFSAFLISSKNSIFKKEHAEVYQDMTRPFYLLGDQITSKSSVEGYIRALQNGCRCIELDCWDGPGNIPVIYHGHTLTSRISFKEVIEAIAKYAFVTSSYPLIISLEIHCNMEQQRQMVQLFKKIFGEALVTCKLCPLNRMPSPAELQRRILLKAKMNFNGRLSESEDEMNRNSFEEKNFKRKNLLCNELKQLIVYCKKIHFDGHFKLHYDQMYSISERKSLQFMKSNANGYNAYTRHHLVRVYPSAMRLNSSNFDPMMHWQFGCQMIAMNHQTFDKNMQLYHSMFQGNGRCGYILKESMNSLPCMVYCKVISAQQLPKPKSSISQLLIDPYIDIELIGIQEDNQRHRTRSVSSNGFNPIWNQEFRFHVQHPNLAFLRFQVQDSNQLIGSFVVHLMNLEQGYRHVPLYNWKGDILRFSSMFVYIECIQRG